jgi:ribonuclease HI
MTDTDNGDNFKIQVYFDGLCQPLNPSGVACYAFIIKANTKRTIHSDFGLAAKPFTDDATNNVAEYTGIIKALEWLSENNLYNEKILVRGDSQLVINQIKRNWKVKAPTIIPLYQMARSLKSKFRNIEIEWISREKNKEADKLSNKAYREALENDPELLQRASPYMATEEQLNLLMSRGVTPEKYLSKIEAKKLISRLI